MNSSIMSLPGYPGSGSCLTIPQTLHSHRHNAYMSSRHSHSHQCPVSIYTKAVFPGTNRADSVSRHPSEDLLKCSQSQGITLQIWHIVTLKTLYWRSDNMRSVSRHLFEIARKYISILPVMSHDEHVCQIAKYGRNDENKTVGWNRESSAMQRKKLRKIYAPTEFKGCQMPPQWSVTMILFQYMKHHVIVFLCTQICPTLNKFNISEVGPCRQIHISKY